MPRPRSTVAPHPFTADPDLPPDQNGRHICAACHLVGEPNDPRHTMPDVPAHAEHLRRYGDD